MANAPHAQLGPSCVEEEGLRSFLPDPAVL